MTDWFALAVDICTPVLDVSNVPRDRVVSGRVARDTEGVSKMGDGTEPRGDDILGMAEEIAVLRRRNAELAAENAELRRTWTAMHNFVRHDFSAKFEAVIDEFMKATSASGLIGRVKAHGQVAAQGGAP